VKLIRCENCNEVEGLSLRWKNCLCGDSGGAYREDLRRVIVAGPCAVYGLSNKVFFATERDEVWRYDESNGRVTRLEENPGSFERAEAWLQERTRL
jgi:hypothetical protein